MEEKNYEECISLINEYCKYHLLNDEEQEQIYQLKKRLSRMILSKQYNAEYKEGTINEIVQEER